MFAEVSQDPSVALGSVFVELMAAREWFTLMNSFHVLLSASGLAWAVGTISASLRIPPHGQEVLLPGIRARQGADGGWPPGGAVGTFCRGFRRRVPGRQAGPWLESQEIVLWRWGCGGRGAHSLL